MAEAKRRPKNSAYFDYNGHNEYELPDKPVTFFDSQGKGVEVLLDGDLIRIRAVDGDLVLIAGNDCMWASSRKFIP